MAMEGSLLRYPAHQHGLIRRELRKECTVVCSFCWSRVGGTTYCCLKCKFFLHESCATIEAPLQLVHPSHSQHSLTLKFSSGTCIYRCRNCVFFMCPMTAIATLSPLEDDKGDQIVLDIMQNFADMKPLIPFHTKKPLSETCRVCNEEIQPGTTAYGCMCGCTFNLHERCAQLPVTMPHHPFHSQHPLTFAVVEEEFSCEACSGYGVPGPAYGCHECGIHFHVQCAAWTLASQDNHETGIEHFSHQQHKLASLHQKNHNPNLSCAACMDDLSGKIHYCFECRFFLHRSCLEEMAPEIIHHLHPEHPLVLGPEPRCNDPVGRFSVFCRSCRGSCLPIMFKCESCTFCIHPACALRTLSAVQKEGLAAEIQHPAHSHPLALCSYSQSNDKCNACCSSLSGLTYSCHLGEFNIHRSCAELPLELQHQLHPPHSLVLSTAPTEAFSCSLCDSKLVGFSFRCTECKFYLDIRCAREVLTFKHPRHEHHLARRHSGQTEGLLCNSCTETVESEYIYRCLSCKFQLHEYCLLDLPHKIDQHECHTYHPLVLLDEFVDKHLRRDDLYCDFCEQKRDADHGVYYCEECDHKFHIDCVVPPKRLPKNSFHDDELDEKIASVKLKIQELQAELDALTTERDAARIVPGRLDFDF